MHRRQVYRSRPIAVDPRSIARLGAACPIRIEGHVVDLSLKCLNSSGVPPMRSKIKTHFSRTARLALRIFYFLGYPGLAERGLTFGSVPPNIGRKDHNGWSLHSPRYWSAVAFGFAGDGTFCAGCEGRRQFRARGARNFWGWGARVAREGERGRYFEKRPSVSRWAIFSAALPALRKSDQGRGTARHEIVP